MFRQLYQPGASYQQPYSKNVQYSLGNSYGYVPANVQQQMYYNASLAQYGAQRSSKGQVPSQSSAKLPRAGNSGYQLKVGGVVVGSWANGARNAQGQRMNRAGMVRISFHPNLLFM